MANKKDNPAPSEDQLLEQRVDAMMDAKRPDSAQEPTAEHVEPAQKTDTGLPPLDIFAGQTSAPEVPKELLKDTDIKQLKTKPPASEQAAPEFADTKPIGADSEPTLLAQDIPEEPLLDDEVSNAAVDDIVAQESDTVLAAEDAVNRRAIAQPTTKPIHHHPVFWTLIAILAIAAVLMATLFITGGNISLPKL